MTDEEVFIEIFQIHRRIGEGRVQRSAQKTDFLDSILRRGETMKSTKAMVEDIRAHIRGPG